MEDYRIEEEDQRRDEVEYTVAAEDEVPFHIPRD